MPDDNPEYTVESTSAYSARVEDIELSRTSTTRKVLRCEIVENVKAANNVVKATIVHQRRSNTIEWQDIEGVPLSRLRAGESAKMSFSTEETKKLIEHLNNLYQIGGNGVHRGVQVLTVANEEAVIASNAGKARILRKIAESENLEALEGLEDEYGGNITDVFAVAKLHSTRKRVLEEYERRLNEDHDENDWKRYLKKHNWIFGVSNIEIIDESRLSIHHDTDLPFSVEGGFMDIVELKRPDEEFWVKLRNGTLKLYRNKFPVTSFEIRAAVAQTADYILEAEKNVTDADFIRDHNGVVPLKPRGLVVGGRSSKWGEIEWKAYRLLNDNLHGIQIITYDQLLERARRSLLMLLE